MKTERNAHKYFGMNHIAKNFEKGFKYKDVTDYPTLKEWLNNVFIAMNENVALKTADGNRAAILDKRLGIYYSLMGIYLTTQEQEKLMYSQEECEEYLRRYYYKHILKISQ